MLLRIRRRQNEIGQDPTPKIQNGLRLKFAQSDFRKRPSEIVVIIWTFYGPSGTTIRLHVRYLELLSIRSGLFEITDLPPLHPYWLGHVFGTYEVEFLQTDVRIHFGFLTVRSGSSSKMGTSKLSQSPFKSRLPGTVWFTNGVLYNTGNQQCRSTNSVHFVQLAGSAKAKNKHHQLALAKRQMDRHLT